MYSFSLNSIIKLVAIVSLFFSIIFLYQSQPLSVFSDELIEYEKELEDIKREREETESYLEYIQGQIKTIQNSGYSLDQQIRLMDAELQKLDEEMVRLISEIEEKEQVIDEKNTDLEKKQSQVDRISDKLYRSSRAGLLEVLFNTASDNNLLHSLILNRFVISSQITYMKMVVGEVMGLNTERDELEFEKGKFEEDQASINESKALLAQQRAQVQAELNRQIEERNMATRRIGGLDRQISELQEFLILMRSGGTSVNIESVAGGGGNSSLAYFRNNAPAGSFGVFSFGAYTHRNGMSQWGAWARNRAGQNYQQILSFYYPGAVLETRNNLMENIQVDGYGSMSFEDSYLMGIREINGAWNTQQDMELLKVQAIAARSYAVARTANGVHSICTTEACQVYNHTNQHGGAWAQAVRDTRGMVLVSGGDVLSTQYAAVHGGWVNNVGYDVRQDKGSWSANISEAWDAISGVNWFYRNWHTRGYGTETCSTHPHPWLSNAEMADLVNAYLYWSHPSVTQDSRLTAIDISTCWGKAANPYSMNELKDMVRSVGRNPVNTVHRVAVSNNNGWTTSITFTTDVGAVTIDSPLVFREVYNMRAPAFFSIPQSAFVHINIEMQ